MVRGDVRCKGRMHRTKTYSSFARVALAAVVAALPVFHPSSLQAAEPMISATMKSKELPLTVSHGDVVKPEPTAPGFVNGAARIWGNLSELKILTGHPLPLNTPRRMTGEWTLGPVFGSSGSGPRFRDSAVGVQIRVAF